MSPPTKIAFIKKGKVPLAGDNVAQILRSNFPQYHLEVIDTTKLIKADIWALLLNLYFTLKEYGPKVLFNLHHFKNRFFRTSFFAKFVKERTARRYGPGDYLFSVQMQSMFDASVEGLPHFVYTDHTALANLSYPGYDKRQLPPPSWLAMEKTIYQNATQVFTRSTNISRSIAEDYDCPPDKVACVYAGANIADASGQADYSAKHILFIGIDWQRKGGPDLVEAFEIVLQTHADAQLTIIGCTPEVDLPNCQVIGRVTLEETRDFYRRASIFCLPTRLEPFGIVFIEAMSYGLPVVATRIGAIPDFVIDGENGYLVPPSYAEKLADALLRLLDDPGKRQAFGAQGRTLVNERYTWEHTGQLMRRHIADRLELPPQTGR